MTPVLRMEVLGDKRRGTTPQGPTKGILEDDPKAAPKTAKLQPPTIAIYWPWMDPRPVGWGRGSRLKFPCNFHAADPTYDLPARAVNPPTVRRLTQFLGFSFVLGVWGLS
uniref:Uncharacterized protein n=1 Tax=Solanum tuberosum TaxID=4113 RepID=M1D844_SOLTU